MGKKGEIIDFKVGKDSSGDFCDIWKEMKRLVIQMAKGNIPGRKEM